MIEEDSRILKRAFCEFFMKLLPSLIDPMLIIRQRWHNFRDILLDENKNAQNVLDYVKELKFGLMQQQLNEAQLPIQDKSPAQQGIEQTYLIKQTQPSSGQPLKIFCPKLYSDTLTNKLVFVKQPSSKKLVIKIQSKEKEENNLDENVERYEIKNLMLNKVQDHSYIHNLPSWRQQRNKFPIQEKQSILSEITQVLKIFRNNTRTLGCVYDKSFEINTGDVKETEGNISQKRIIDQADQMAAQQDMQFIRSNQREKSLKKYSIFAKNQSNGSISIDQNDDKKQILI